MLSGIKQQAVVGKDGKIEVKMPELVEGTSVEVIILVDLDDVDRNPAFPDETEYLLSTKANRQHLLTAIQSLETKDRSKQK